MICISCKNEFDNINGLKFCPYCGTRIEEVISEVDEQDSHTEVFKESIDTGEVLVNSNKLHDTLKMPAITKKDIKRYNREKFFSSLIKPFKNIKVVISLATTILIIALGVFGYIFFSNRTVDEARIKQDLIGKVIVLPKGTSFEIKKGYIKSFSINSRNTKKSEGKDDINVAVILNNGSIEAKTLLAIHYIDEGKSKWRINDKLELVGDTVIKPVTGMDEKLFIEALKKQSIGLGGTSKALGEDDVKALSVVERTPDFDNLKESALVDVSIDNGLIAATGKLKCSLGFENETWSLTKVEKNSNDDFKVVLSPNFSQDRIVEAVKNAGLNETVTDANVFSGKGFYVKDNFTKTINLGGIGFDDQKGALTVTAKRENTAGELKTMLSTDYTFKLAVNKLDLINKSKTAVDSVTVNDLSKDFIISSITGVEVEGGSILFWFSDNHKITSDEAKTFKSDKVLSKKGLQNVKYVYGSVTYADGSKKSKAIVATYYLVYDNAKGYSWKLDRIVGEDSPNYKLYLPEPH